MDSQDKTLLTLIKADIGEALTEKYYDSLRHKRQFQGAASARTNCGRIDTAKQYGTRGAMERVMI